jgi:hypothetical protein
MIYSEGTYLQFIHSKPKMGKILCFPNVLDVDYPQGSGSRVA